MPPLTKEESELDDLRSELRLIEGLLSDVLRRKTVVQSRLDQLVEPNGPGCSTPDISWSSVVKNGKVTKKGRKRNLPFFSPDSSTNTIPMANFFSPLAHLRELEATPEPRAISKLALASGVLTPMGSLREPQATEASPAASSMLALANGTLTNVDGLLGDPRPPADQHQQVRTNRKRPCPPLSPTIIIQRKRTRKHTPSPPAAPRSDRVPVISPLRSAPLDTAADNHDVINNTDVIEEIPAASPVSVPTASIVDGGSPMDVPNSAVSNRDVISSFDATTTSEDILADSPATITTATTNLTLDNKIKNNPLWPKLTTFNGCFKDRPPEIVIIGELRSIWPHSRKVR